MNFAIQNQFAILEILEIKGSMALQEAIRHGGCGGTYQVRLWLMNTVPAPATTVRREVEVDQSVWSNEKSTPSLKSRSAMEYLAVKEFFTPQTRLMPVL